MKVNVERMRRYVDRTAPDTVTLASGDGDYLEHLAEWRSRMAAKHDGGGHIHLRLDPVTGLVTATFSDGPS